MLDDFVRYYDGDRDYADSLIRDTLAMSGSWSGSHRRAIVLRSSHVMVLFFGALQALYEAVSDCKTASSFRSGGASDTWDKGTAIIIGSLETLEGYMYYDLAEEH